MAQQPVLRAEYPGTIVCPEHIDDAISRLVSHLPELAEVAAETEETYDGFAPTGFMGLLRQWALRHTEDAVLLAKVLVEIDDAFVAGDSEMRNAISVGFVEDLVGDPSKAAQAVVALFGPALTEEGERFRQAQPWVHYSEAGWRAVTTASPAHRSSGATIDDDDWWYALADWVVEASRSADREAAQALLDDLDAEVARETSRGRPYILSWFLPRILASSAAGELRSMLGPHLAAGI